MNKFLNLIPVFIIIVLVTACTKQNEPKALDVDIQLKRSNDYFANLRAYKASPHQIYFGWFGGTGGPGNPSFAGIYDAIPDSVDIVSLWGGYPPLGSHNHQLLQKNRSLKGIKFVWCMFGSGVESLMKKNDNTLFLNDKMLAIEKVAKAMADTIALYQLDGFDLDYEPSEASERNAIFGTSFDSPDGSNQYVFKLFQELGKYMGPKSGTENLLIIDGYSEKGVEPYYNYFMQQAYNSSSGANLSSRLLTYGLGECPPEKFVPCENFEDHWRSGGVNFSDPVRGTIPSLFGFAYWQPSGGRKGGIGSYHTEYEYALTPDYYYTRRAIQIMNPAAK